jgi:hypothetical protein
VTFVNGMFNFTIQGLPPKGSVKVTITFPRPMPAGVVWWRVISGNPCAQSESGPFPTNQTLVNGNNMTLTLTNASSDGVISMVGGAAFPPEAPTSTAAVSTNTLNLPTPQPSVNQASSLIPPLASIVLVLAAVMLYRRRHVNHNRV